MFEFSSFEFLCVPVKPPPRSRPGTFPAPEGPLLAHAVSSRALGLMFFQALLFCGDLHCHRPPVAAEHLSVGLSPWAARVQYHQPCETAWGKESRPPGYCLCTWGTCSHSNTEYTGLDKTLVQLMPSIFLSLFSKGPLENLKFPLC